MSTLVINAESTTTANVSNQVKSPSKPQDGHTFQQQWHTFWNNFAKPHRDPAALSFARLGLLGTRW